MDIFGEIESSENERRTTTESETSTDLGTPMKAATPRTKAEKRLSYYSRAAAAGSKRRRTGQSTEPGAASTRVYDFDDAEDVLNTAGIAETNDVTNLDILSYLKNMERRIIGRYEKTIKEKEKQVSVLTARVEELEQLVLPNKKNRKKTTTTADIRAAVRGALKDAETKRGLTLVSGPLKSQHNNRVTKYAFDYIRTEHPDVTQDEFIAAVERARASQKEKKSREDNGKQEKHRAVARRNNRKLQKSRNRVIGIDASSLLGPERERVKRVMAMPALMSTDESGSDDDGNKVFWRHPRGFDSKEFTEKKNLADRMYERMKKAGFGGTMVPRLTGTPSRSRPPVLMPEDEWVNHTLAHL